MKLLLASNGDFLIKQGYLLLGIPKSDFRIGYVITASKTAKDKSYIQNHEQLMKESGYNFSEIDIEGKSIEQLRELFKDKNVLHMEGGDTFYLLKAIKNSNFDKVIKELLSRGLVYVGTSAGSSVAGPTIEMSSHIPSGTTADKLEGLNLVSFLIKCHYTEDKADQLKRLVGNLRHSVRFLRDGQAFLVEDDQVKLVGMGEEVKL